MTKDAAARLGCAAADNVINCIRRGIRIPIEIIKRTFSFVYSIKKYIFVVYPNPPPTREPIRGPGRPTGKSSCIVCLYPSSSAS